MSWGDTNMCQINDTYLTLDMSYGRIYSIIHDTISITDETYLFHRYDT